MGLKVLVPSPGFILTRNLDNGLAAFPFEADLEGAVDGDLLGNFGVTGDDPQLSDVPGLGDSAGLSPAELSLDLSGVAEVSSLGDFFSLGVQRRTISQSGASTGFYQMKSSTFCGFDPQPIASGQMSVLDHSKQSHATAIPSNQLTTAPRRERRSFLGTALYRRTK